MPVDSEHSAIFQCVQGCADRRESNRLVATCSGGPFYGMSREEVGKMTKADALRHPNWQMGPKITVDSATLMNKGLEVIEAMRLYRLPLSQVDVVVHRQSIIHSMVEYRDGAVMAQLGTPDMRLPIRYAVTYPARGESPAEPLNLLTCPPLTFAAPDREAFPCLKLAEEAATEGGTACAVLNGANEEAVRLFLEDRVGFQDIPRLVAGARVQCPWSRSRLWKISWRQTGRHGNVCYADLVGVFCMKLVYILAAVLIFGVLIAVHELGHFLAAKLCGVRVNEVFHRDGTSTLARAKRGDRILPAGIAGGRLLRHGRGGRGYGR